MDAHRANKPAVPVSRKSLATRLTWVSILMVAFAILTVGTGLIFIADRAQHESAHLLQGQYAERVSELISGYMIRAVDRLRFFAENESLATKALENQKAALEKLLINSLPLYSQVSYLNKDGQELVKISRFHTFLPGELTSQVDSEAFITARSGSHYMGPVAFFEDTGLLSVKIATPITRISGEIDGVLTAEVNVSHLWRAVSDITIGRTGYAYLVDMNGRFLAYQMPAEVLQRYGEDMSGMPPVSAFLATGPKGTGEVKEYDGLFGKRVIGTYSPIRGTSWAVLVEKPVREAYATVRKMQKYLLGLMFIGVVLSGSLGFFVSQKLIKPIKSLTNAAKKLSKGDLEAKFIDLKGDNEVAILSQTFKIMQSKLIELYKGLRNKVEELQLIQKTLKESEEKFRTLVEESPLGITIIGSDNYIKYINPTFNKIFGYDIDYINMNLNTFLNILFDHNYHNKADEFFNSNPSENIIGQSISRVFDAESKGGERRTIHFQRVTLHNLDQLIICEDITEKSKLERRLQQVQKFEAIGTLAGGIAHDFNNILMGIQGHTSLIRMDAEPTSPLIADIDTIEEYIKSASDLTRQLLGIARGGKYEVKPFDINEVVLNTSSMFGRTKKEIQIQTKVNASRLVVEADKRQIEQVLLNIYVNAWQAMPEGGDLFLETKRAFLDEAYCHPHEIEPGAYAVISVVDTGIGMDENTRTRIFDPFFTTKEKSRGTGLGLASAYGIIKNHGGIITVYSEVGQGTNFNVYLPASDKEPQPDTRTKGDLIKGSGTILLVDDEKMILHVGKAMLEKLGYRVYASGSGKEALVLVEELGEALDLVILDLIMPGMDGGRTFDRIRKIQPGLPVLLASGYAMNGQAEAILRRGCNGFIHKPFNLHELGEKVGRLLVDS